MKNYMKPRKNTWSTLVQKSARLQLLAWAAVSCGLTVPSVAEAQFKTCFENESNLQVFMDAEKTGERQVEVLWQRAGRDCSRLTELSGDFTMLMGKFLELREKVTNFPMECRVNGRLNGLSVTWTKIMEGCSNPSVATSAEPRSEGLVCQ